MRSESLQEGFVDDGASGLLIVSGLCCLVLADDDEFLLFLRDAGCQGSVTPSLNS